MTLAYKIKWYTPQGNKVYVDVEVWRRKNSEYSTDIIRYKGRRIAPYEQRLRGWKITLNGLFKLVYGSGEYIKHMLYDNNLFLKKISKDTGFFHVPVEIRKGEHY